LLFAGVLVGGLTYGVHYHRKSVAATTEPQPTSLRERIQPFRDALGQVTNSLVGPEQFILKEQAEAALLELRKFSLSIEIQSASQAFQRMKLAVESWETQKQLALTSDAGRRIAGNEKRVARFIAIRRISEPLADSVSRFDRLLELLKQDRLSKDDPNQFHKSVKQLRELSRSMEEALTNSTLCSAMLTDLLNRDTNGTLARQALAEAILAGERDFDDLLSSSKLRQKQETNAQVQKELDERRDSSETLSAVIADLEGKISDVKAGKMPAANASPFFTTASRDSYRNDQDRIRTLLKPFVSPGYAQPASRDEFEYTATKTPMSLSMIAKAGGLENSSTGLETLFRIGGTKSTSQHNDRPLGNFPKMNSTAELAQPDVASRLRQAQRMLRIYGPMLVKDGLLKP
jgi:predicted  nucleic acid-binding Zn-ribbon protein